MARSRHHHTVELYESLYRRLVRFATGIRIEIKDDTRLPEFYQVHSWEEKLLSKTTGRILAYLESHASQAQRRDIQMVRDQVHKEIMAKAEVAREDSVSRTMTQLEKILSS